MKHKTRTYKGAIVILKAISGRHPISAAKDIEKLDIFIKLENEDSYVGGRLFGKNAFFEGAKGFRYEAEVLIEVHPKYGEQIKRFVKWKPIKKD